MRPTPHCSCRRLGMNPATVCDIEHLLPLAHIRACDGLGGQPAGEDAGSEECALERALAVQAPAAEPGGLAGGIETGYRIAVGPKHAAAEVRLDAAEALPGHHLEADRQQRHGLVVHDLLKARGAQPV